MESLLNLCWLLLMVPALAFWLPKRRLRNSLQLAVVLVCLLVLLFPVISATDDLNAMRQETEESSPGSPELVVAKASSGQRAVGPAPALIGAIFQIAVSNHTCGYVQVLSPAARRTARTTPSLSRAPPSSLPS
jgi:hypothetical protein